MFELEYKLINFEKKLADQDDYTDKLGNLYKLELLIVMGMF